MQYAFRFHTLIFGLALLMDGASFSVAQGLPVGASALNETHGDWRVPCQVADQTVRCAITQTPSCAARTASACLPSN